jgi:hypothetical protein
MYHLLPHFWQDQGLENSVKLEHFVKGKLTVGNSVCLINFKPGISHLLALGKQKTLRISIVLYDQNFSSMLSALPKLASVLPWPLASIEGFRSGLGGRGWVTP